MGKTDELVPREALEDLKKLDEQLAKTQAGMLSVFNEASKLREALSDVAIPYKDLVTAITKYEKVQKEAKKTAQEANANMQAREKLQKRIIELDTAENKELQKLQIAVQEKTKATKNAIREDKEAEGSLNKMRIALNRMRAEYDGLAGTVRDSAYGENLAREIRKVNDEVLRIEQATGRSQRNVGNYFGSFVKGAGSLIGVGTAIAAVTKAIGVVTGAFSAAFDFEKATSKLAASLQTTKKDVKELTEDARRLGSATQYTAAEAVALQTELAKLGFNKQQILESSGAILKFAQATDAGLSEAAELAGAAVQSFGADMKETERYAAAMAVATAKSALSFGDLHSSLSTVALVAKSFGFSIEDTLALLGKLSDAGFDASTAATATRNILLNLADANGKLAQELGGSVKTLPELVKALTELRERGVSLGETLELTDKRSVAAFNTFMEGAEGIQTLRTQLTGVEDELTQMSETMNDNVLGAWAGLSSAWEGFVLSVIQSTGWIKDALNGVASLIRGVTGLITKENEAGMYKDAIKKSAEIEIELGKLTSRYTELYPKVDKNEAEHEELAAVMERIRTLMPGVVGEFDKYGKVLSINTEKIIENIEAQKRQYVYEHQDVSDQIIKQIEKDEKKLEELEKTRARRDRLRKGELTPQDVQDIAGLSLINVRLAFNTDTSEIEKEMVDISKSIENNKLLYEDFIGVSHDKILEETRLRDELNALDREGIEAKIAGFKKEQEITNGLIVTNRDASKEDIEAWTERNKKAAEYFMIANQILDTRFIQPQNEQDQRDKADKLAVEKKKEEERLKIAKDAAKERERLAREEEAERKRRDEAERKAAQELSVFLIKSEADAQKAIADNENEAFEDRKEALQAYYRAQVEAVNRAAENQLSDEKLTASQRALIQEKLMAELKKLEYAYYKGVEDLENDRLAAMEKNAQKQIKAAEKSARSRELGLATGESGDLENAAAAYAKGELTHEQYEKRKTDITFEYAKRRMEAELKVIRELLNIEGLAAGQREQLMQKLEDITLRYEKAIADERISLEEETARRREDIEKSLIEKRKELISEAMTFIDSLFKAGFENRLNEIDEQKEAAGKAAEDEIERVEKQEEAGVISREQADAQKELIEYNAQLRDEMLENKRKQMLERQAKYERASAIAGTVINTAFAIMKQLAATPLPLGIPLIAAVAAVGALQLASIMAQPLPKYAAGTDDHPGGPAIVGDGGKRELIILPSGRRFLTPEKPVLVDLPEHTGILPDAMHLIGKEAAKLNGHADSRIHVEMDTGQLVAAQKETNAKLNDIELALKKIRANSVYAEKMRRLDITIHQKKNRL